MSSYDLIKELLQEIERLQEELAQYQQQTNKNEWISFRVASITFATLFFGIKKEYVPLLTYSKKLLSE